MDQDAMDEKMAEEIYAALQPLRYFHDEYDEGMSFDKYHEKAELLLLGLLDKWYAIGFKDGVADERYTREMSEQYDE